MVDTLQQSKRRRYSRHEKATAGVSRGSFSLEALWPYLMGGKGSSSLKSGAALWRAGWHQVFKLYPWVPRTFSCRISPLKPTSFRSSPGCSRKQAALLCSTSSGFIMDTHTEPQAGLSQGSSFEPWAQRWGKNKKPFPAQSVRMPTLLQIPSCQAGQKLPRS